MDIPGIFFFKIDLNGVLEFINQELAKLLGMKRSDVLGKKISDIFDPEDYAQMESFAMGMKKGLPNQKRELRFTCKKAKLSNIQFHACPYYNAQDVIVGIIASGYDITPEVKLHDLLKEKEDQYNQLLNQISDIIILVDKDGRIADASPSTETVFNMDPKKSIGMHIWDVALLSSDQRKHVRDIFFRILNEKEGTREEINVTTIKGEPKIIETIGTPTLKKGNPIGAVIIGRDITQRKQMEEDLRESEERYRLIYEGVSDIIAVLDLQGIIIDVSPSLKAVQGYAPEEFIGKHFLEAFRWTDESRRRIEKEFSEIINSKTRQRKEYDIFTKDGTKITVEGTTSHNIKYQDKDCIISIIRDITERKQLYERATEFKMLKSNLVATAAHELKTPLTSISGWTEMFYSAKLAGKSIDETFELEDFETVLRNCDRLTDLINDFLDVSRIEANELRLQREAIDIAEIIKNALQVVEYSAGQKKITISVQVPSFEIFVDPRRIEQVIINLLSNSIKYSPEGTTVRISMGGALKPKAKSFQIIVTDQGYGFTPEELSFAMEPFGKVQSQQETKKTIKGTGLGLFISKSIIEQHKGSLLVQSPGPNQGSKVTISLPLRHSE